MPSSSIGLDDDGAFALAVFAEADAAGDLGHDGRVARPACLEDFGDARQTAGDVLRAADFARRLGEQRCRPTTAGRLADFQVGLFRDVVDFEALAPLVLDDDLRVQIALVLHDDPAFGAGGVAFLAERFAFDDVLEADPAAALGEDRDAVRVPFAQRCARLDRLAVLDEQHGAVGNREFLEDAVLGPDDVRSGRCASGRSVSPLSLVTAVMRIELDGAAASWP